MTGLETSKLIAVMIELYPHFAKDRNIPATVDIWHKVFANEPYRDVEAALYAFFSTDEKGFAPVPGNLRAILANLRKPEGEMTEQEAWALVRKATSNSLYNAQTEFDKLPVEIQACVGSPSQLRDWAEMDTETLNSVVASNFQRSYRARAVHARDMQKLPPAVREVFGLIGDAMRLPGTEAKRPALLPEEGNAPEPEPTRTDSVREREMAKIRNILKNAAARSRGAS